MIVTCISFYLCIPVHCIAKAMQSCASYAILCKLCNPVQAMQSYASYAVLCHGCAVTALATSVLVSYAGALHAVGVGLSLKGSSDEELLLSRWGRVWRGPACSISKYVLQKGEFWLNNPSLHPHVRQRVLCFPGEV